MRPTPKRVVYLYRFHHMASSGLDDREPGTGSLDNNRRAQALISRSFACTAILIENAAVWKHEKHLNARRSCAPTTEVRPVTRGASTDVSIRSCRSFGWIGIRGKRPASPARSSMA
jgi:hypothetical protein